MSGADAGSETPEAGNKRRRTSGMYQRRRAVAACGPCRVRKTKCDNVRPACGFCQRNGGLCTYPDTTNDFSTFDPASLAILDRINHVVNLLESRPPAPLPVSEPTCIPAIPHGSQILSPTSINGPQGSSCAVVDETQCQTDDGLPEDDVMTRFDIPDLAAASWNCETILRWPIFRDTVPEINSFILELEDDDPDCMGVRKSNNAASLGRGVQEDDFTVLSKKFLAYVHVKNPVLDVPDFRAHVKAAIENGPRWDGPSCLVLIACALACLATHFEQDSFLNSTPESIRSTASNSTDPDTAQAYFFAAKKRLGLLEPSLLQVQCLFFCGVFEMYSLRPLPAWSYFNQACVQFKNLLWRRTQRRAPENMSQKARRLEQRLYWSCMKSECELRCEIPLPSSGITRLSYPDLFPSPPSEVATPAPQPSSLDILEDDIQPEEEKSWFYYLAEISSRRMINRAISIMGYHGEEAWIRNIAKVIEKYEDFDRQINVWCCHIPSQINWQNREHSSNELVHYIQNRAESCREWIHRPFVYYVIHQPPDDPWIPRVLPLAEKGLEIAVELLLDANPHHRHHGTWFMARAAMTRALLVLAAAKSGRFRLPDRWKHAVDSATWALQRWYGEAPDLRKAASVLEELMGQIVSAIASALYTGSAGSKTAHVEGIVRSASLCRGFARALEQTSAASRDAGRKDPGTVATAKTIVVRRANASKDEYWTRIIVSTTWRGFVVKRAAAKRSIWISAASNTRNALLKTANYGGIGTRTDYGIIARSTTESYDASTKTVTNCVYPTVATVATTNAPSRAVIIFATVKKTLKDFSAVITAARRSGCSNKARLRLGYCEEHCCKIDKCLNFNDTGSDKLCYEHSRTELHKKIKHLEDRLRGRGYESHHYDDLKCRHDKLARDYDGCLLRLNESREEIRMLRSTWISEEDNRIWRKDLEDRNARLLLDLEREQRRVEHWERKAGEVLRRVDELEELLAEERLRCPPTDVYERRIVDLVRKVEILEEELRIERENHTLHEGRRYEVEKLLRTIAELERKLADEHIRSARVDELFKKVEILQAMLAGEREQKDILLEDIAKRDEYDRCYRERCERRRWRRGSFERKRPFPERVERVVERERVYGVGC
ncbi:2og-fe oxygenase superfamily protein [Colletotrichum camelliae]|nr:2og-fe oxygenase superfamily protein [Colletotrichum camelliae]